MNKIVNPEGWPRPKGYANGVVANGRQLHIAGQVGWDEAGRFPGPDFLEQTEQALKNIVQVLKAAGGGPEHLVRMTWYVTDRQVYKSASQELGAIYRAVIGAHFPAMTAVEVSGLIEDEAVVEIEATAVLPEK